MIDVLLVLLALCLVPVALMGLLVLGAAVGTAIGLPIAFVLDKLEARRKRRRRPPGPYKGWM